nr:MDIS1-interacting receptor like kinase 2-like [Ziziphus jujuba var. spinosa]
MDYSRILPSPLSSKWGQCHNLTYLNISNNNISGSVPPALRGATRLQVLDLSSNHLSGKIPKELQNLKLLLELILSGNQLYGEIPSGIGMLVDLKKLHLVANNLSGPVPKEVGDCLKLWQLNLKNNKLEGSVPFEIDTMNSLQILDLGSNLLNREIPSQLGQMKRLETLNLSHNYLSSSIPSSFNEMSCLMLIDMSYNQLKGPILDSKAFRESPFDAFKNNRALCGNASGLELCATMTINPHGRKGNKVVVLITLVPLLCSLFLMSTIFGILNILCRKVKKIENLHDLETQNKNLFAIWSYDGKLVYENIIQATEEFNSKYCIGEGGYGSVYKVELSLGQVVVVKKLHISVDGGMSHFKAFTSEISTLTETRHRNIVKVYGFCSHPWHSLLVYEYLEGGSLGDVLRNEEKARAFEWSKRVNVMKGVANALSYMHHDCLPPIVHRYIKSQNILLNVQHDEAHILDFGTARIVKIDSSN